MHALQPSPVPVSYAPGRFWFVALTALATLVLIGLGGVVTSKGVGLAVPDWPTTYGYNMFLFPISQWVGGVFYEHTHRLFASFVGLLTTVLAVWIGWKDPRRWMKWLGLMAFVLVCLQGVLGGLRVVWLRDEIGIVHAALAQLFLVLVCSLALFSSCWWLKIEQHTPQGRVTPRLRTAILLATGLIFAQLILGAAMRHQHAGLAVPDFPLAYGRLWPPMDAESIEAINRDRIHTQNYNPITALQIGLHMAHRIGALVIFLAVSWVAWSATRLLPATSVPRRLARIWWGMILLQAGLGALTVWSNKAADMATAHVVLGAASLALGGLLSIICRKISVDDRARLGHSPPAFSASSGKPAASASSCL